MRRLLPSFFALTLTVAAFAAAPAADLFNGKDLTGWELVAADKTAALADICTIKPDGVIAVSGRPTGFFQTTASYTNYRIHVEWRWSGKPGNGGVLVHIASGAIDRNTWPLSFQIQTKNKAVGDLLPMAGAKFAETLTSAPNAAVAQRAHTAADSEKPAGEWNACDIVCNAGTIEVTVNGVLQNRVSQCAPATGKVGFQLEGTPFELRNVTLTPLGN